MYKCVAGHMTLEKKLPGNYFGGNSNGKYWGFISQIRGMAENQIIVVGESNTIRYFNGMRWTQLGTPYDAGSGTIWSSIAVTGDLIAIVGKSYDSRGIIMMLKRE